MTIRFIPIPRFLLPLALAITLAAISLYAFAGPGGGGALGGMPGHHARMDAAGDVFREEMMARRLGLSDEQRGRIQAINAAHREAIRPYVRALVGGHRAMRELMHADTFDEGAVRALATKHHAAMTEMMVLKAARRFDIRQVLTADQRARMRHRHHRPDDEP